MGEGHDGIDSLAVWQLSPLGTTTGAWIVPQNEAFGSRDAARRLITVLERRAITATELEHIDPMLDQFNAAAELDEQRWWAYESTIEAARARRANVAELSWRRDFIPADCTDFASVRRTASVHASSESPVARECADRLPRPGVAGGSVERDRAGQELAQLCA